MPLILVLPTNYPYVLMGLAANYLFAFMCNGFFVAPARKAVFTEEFLKPHAETHKAAFPEQEID